MAPRGSSRAPGWVRRWLARCERTAPFGRPVLPLVKKATWASRSLRPDASAGPSWRPSARAPRPSRVNLGGDDAGAGRSVSVTTRSGRQVSKMAPDSSAPSRPFTGMKTAPILARAANSGTASSVVADHRATRDRRPIPSVARALASWSARASRAPNVRERSPRAAAVRSGTALAALLKTSPMRRSLPAITRPFHCSCPTRTVILEWRRRQGDGVRPVPPLAPRRRGARCPH